jgi:tRNA uridine 5-carboxymethylaminomethyl modification enzyme
VLRPDRRTSEWLRNGGLEITSETTFGRLMQRADLDLDRLLEAADSGSPELAAAFRDLTEEERDGVVSQLRYAGYIERQAREAERLRADDDLRIPPQMDFALPGLSREMVEKLTRVRPASLGQAGRIPGVTPAAVAIVRMHVRRGPSVQVSE